MRCVNKSRFLQLALAAFVVAAVAAVGVYLVRGDRWRLYADARAGHCWNAIESLALPSSSIRPVRVTIVPETVRIEYLMDRVLAGATLDAECVYAEGEQGARSISLNGMPLDAETLRSLNE